DSQCLQRNNRLQRVGSVSYMALKDPEYITISIQHQNECKSFLFAMDLFEVLPREISFQFPRWPTQTKERKTWIRWKQIQQKESPKRPDGQKTQGFSRSAVLDSYTFAKKIAIFTRGPIKYPVLIATFCVSFRSNSMPFQHRQLTLCGNSLSSKFEHHQPGTVKAGNIVKVKVRDLNHTIRIIVKDVENKEPEEAMNELKRLRKENQTLKEKIEQLTKEHKTFKDNPKLFMFYTGFQSYDLFKIFFEFLGPAVNKINYWGSNTRNDDSVTPEYSKRGPKRQMNPEQELFIVLARLRCGLLEQDLAVRCKLSTSHLSRICITWIDILHSHLRAIPIWASKASIQKTMPSCFRISYPTTRVILDCTELFIEMASSYRTQSATFSSYKHQNTAKGLIGIARNGAVTFVSELYPGRTSDQCITKHSGILQLLEEGDSVMADRGFDILEDLPDGVTLNIPAFMRGKDQLTVEEETETRRIASVRIHVERAIERIKNYRILQGKYPTISDVGKHAASSQVGLKSTMIYYIYPL
ncbi:Hypothetical predicted protein, partial [Paramuricea clavata]